MYRFAGTNTRKYNPTKDLSFGYYPKVQQVVVDLSMFRLHFLFCTLYSTVYKPVNSKIVQDVPKNGNKFGKIITWL